MAERNVDYLYIAPENLGREGVLSAISAATGRPPEVIGPGDDDYSTVRRCTWFGDKYLLVASDDVSAVSNILLDHQLGRQNST